MVTVVVNFFPPRVMHMDTGPHPIPAEDFHLLPLNVGCAGVNGAGGALRCFQ